MATDDILQKALDLTERLFTVTSGLDLPRSNNRWHAVVTVSLVQAHERLASIRVLLNNNYWDSSVILTRSIFELAVNLSYISKDVEKRLPQYLRHGGIPVTAQEIKQLEKEFSKCGKIEVKDIVPGRAWKNLKDMCCDLGSAWLAEYETFYPYASIPTHAGSFTLGKNYLQLIMQQPPSDDERALVLVTAITFHIRVATLAAETFPKQIAVERINEFQNECNELGQALRSS